MDKTQTCVNLAGLVAFSPARPHSWGFPAFERLLEVGVSAGDPGEVPSPPGVPGSLLCYIGGRSQTSIDQESWATQVPSSQFKGEFDDSPPVGFEFYSRILFYLSFKD